MKERNLFVRLLSSNAVESTLCFCTIVATVAGCLFPFYAVTLYYFSDYDKIDFFGVAAVSGAILGAAFVGKVGQEWSFNKYKTPQAPPAEEARIPLKD